MLEASKQEDRLKSEGVQSENVRVSFGCVFANLFATSHETEHVQQRKKKNNGYVGFWVGNRYIDRGRFGAVTDRKR